MLSYSIIQDKQRTNGTICDYSPELSLLIACCRQPSDIKHIQSVVGSITDFKHFTELASKHGVFPLVYRAIRVYASGLIDSEIIKEMKHTNLRIVGLNLLMSAELIKITNLLEQHGIPVIPFKGPVLAQLAYGDIALRQFGDLDILIREEHLYRAGELIVQAGYEPMATISYLRNPAKLYIEKNFEFYNRKNGVKLEMHWRFTNRIFSTNIEPCIIWGELQKVQLLNEQLKTMSVQYLLLYLCAHGAYHMWERIEWIVDIDRLLTAHADLDWESLLQKAKDTRSETTFLLGLAMTKHLFGTAIPTEINHVIENNPAIKKLQEITVQSLKGYLLYKDFTSNSKNYEMFRFNVALQDGRAAKVSFLTQTLFHWSDRDVMVINLPRHLFFLYYPIRIVRIALKYLVSPVEKIFRKE